MALLQRNARSLLLLRLIGKNRDFQSSELRALSHFIRPHDGHNAAEVPLRPYSAVSGSLASPFSSFTQAGDAYLTDSTSRGHGTREGRHNALSQTGVLPGRAIPISACTMQSRRSALYSVAGKHCMPCAVPEYVHALQSASLQAPYARTQSMQAARRELPCGRLQARCDLPSSPSSCYCSRMQQCGHAGSGLLYL